MHSGFNIYCGQAVSPLDDEDVERLSQYIVRDPLSQERMTYIPEHESPNGTAKVVYQGKTIMTNETFTALDWLARLITHIPNKGEQTVRYYGYYSNKFRGMRKKKNTDDNVLVPVITDIKRKKFRKNWARLINGSRLVVRSGRYAPLYRRFIMLTRFCALNAAEPCV